MTDKVTGIILAGGKSRRMGKDKSFLPLRGKPLIENLKEELSPIFKNLIIIANSPRRYQNYGLKVKPDIIKDCGPLGGIYTGLIYSSTEYNFVVACDMPFINQQLIKSMLLTTSGYDVIVPRFRGKLQPLFAVYSKKCIQPIANQLHRKKFKITDFFSQVKIRIIRENEISHFDSEGNSFVNINTNKDYQSIIK